MGTILDESDAETASSSSSSQRSTPTAEDVEAYNRLMSSLFPVSELPPPPGPPQDDLHDSHTHGQLDDDEENNVMENGIRRPMTKAEKQNAKKKRRKERERLARLQSQSEAKAFQASDLEASGISPEQNKVSSIPFRLFSACPIRPILLIEENGDYVSPENPRHLPLSSAKLERIRRQAAEAAVTMDDIYAETQRSNPGPSSRAGKVTQLEVSSDTLVGQLPEIFLGRIPIYQRQTRPLGGQISSRESSSVTTVNLRHPYEDSSKIGSRRSKTRRGKRRKPNAVQAKAAARFWAPPPDLGGKARGYAWGYRDSMEGRREKGAWSGYVRSKDW
ncbi:uncharacterized protein I303_103285 [Kwoniella dejecticola CBS 10117]|uniref:Uncharacterized protein n=1 Tax=Kwoniella dejecticola CBS 10117 TaxID=1296121 RepID=A0A1A6A6B0_9TREE|nr:uncharacterized protein I303_03309 [Kwoniella dejecticola CBS 10117]OBR85598.1 hypothetical protein I303_03309 [Kwoniella dejecticola CBS 10117]